MWNDFDVGKYEGMIAETVKITGHEGKKIPTYLSRPLGEGPFPGIVLISHGLGWDEYCREIARRFSQHGYAVACPNIFYDGGNGTPSQALAGMREIGGLCDDHVMADCAGAMEYLESMPVSNGKTGVIGMCSGGRHAFMAACMVDGFKAAVDCWGGGVILSEEEKTPRRPYSAIDLTEKLACPLLGIFGNDDPSPTPEVVDLMEAELIKYGKDYDFHRYDGAAHGFWSYDRHNYRHEQAMASWEVVYDFFEKHLR